MEQLVPAEMKPGLDALLETVAPMRRARRLVVAAVLLTSVLLSLTAADHFVRTGRDQAAVHWMRVLDLCQPAFHPSGTARRHPSALPFGIDPRHAPSAFRPDPVGLTGAGASP
jgi:hypothetical protein